MSNRCIVKGCPNHKGEGLFMGDLCAPCHRMLTTGSISPGQTFIHQMSNSTTVPKLVLCSEFLHCGNANGCLHAKWHGANGRGHENDRAKGCTDKHARCRGL